MKKQNAVVIGAGVGGIATAARLAQQGYQVTVVEKCKIPGGRCGFLERDGYHFDTGPTLFLMPQLYEQAFADLGECIEDHLELQRVDPTYRIHFKDGTVLALSSDLSAMRTQLEAIEPGSFRSFLSYLEDSYEYYGLSIEHLVGRNFRNIPEFFNLKNLLLIFRLNALRNHYDHVSRYFSDERLKVAFSFQNMYMGLSPFEAPAVFSLMQYTEFADGIWFPKGGMYSIVEALMKIARAKGAQFIFNTPVKRIDINNRKASGVTLTNGKYIPADIVVANADLPYVYRELLPDDHAASKLDRKRYGCSAIMFFWGLDQQYPQLGTHNLFMAEDYRQSFDPIFKQLTLPKDPNIYVHAPTRVDPSLAPQGGDAITVALPVSYINEAAPQDWVDIKKRARAATIAYLARVGITDIESHIKFEICYTPPYWRNRYNLVKGSAHGLSHNLQQMGYMRPHNRHAVYKNLYFVAPAPTQVQVFLPF
jgi:phytoene desaturase